MKKLLVLMMAAALALSLVACGGGGGAGDTNTPSTGNGDTTSTGTPSSGEDNTNTNTPDNGKDSTTDIHKVGDTVESTNYRFTLKDATFTRNILVCRGEKADKETFRKAEEFFTATDEPFVDEDGKVIEGIHGFGIGADKDDIYLYFNLEVEFIGTEERTVGTQDLKPAVSYGDYKFTSDYMSFYREIRDDALWFNFDTSSGGTSTVKALGLEIGYFNGTFKPLSSPPIEIRGVIRVPKAVAEHTDGDVVISFAGKDFIIE